MRDKTSTFINKLRAYDAAKHDEVAPQGAIVYNYGHFAYKGRPIRITETAFRQICGGCGIPVDFWVKRLNVMERTPIFNRLVQEQGDIERLYRFHGDDELYGVVSSKYRKLDNVRVLEILKAADDAGVGLRPVRWHLDPDHSKFRLIPTDAKVGELTPMIEVINSENGLGSLQVFAGVYRFKCSNGLLVPVSEITYSRWLHLGVNDIQLPDLNIVLSRSRECVQRLDNTRSHYLSASDKTRFVTIIAGALGQKVADKFSDTANREYRGGGTLFDTINSLTRAAQSFSPAQQTEVERFAGRLLAA